MSTIEEQIAELTKPQQIRHWGDSYDVTPALVDKVFGDGQLLVKLFPISERPHHWVVRVDSAWATSADSFIDHIDDIYDAIDDQFGPPPEDDLGTGDERPYFPSYDGEGCCWAFVTVMRGGSVV